MARSYKGNDLRVRRTRQSLQNAFKDLIQEKGFSAISIQDITERAMVNRGTFYAHFTDKYALLNILFREQFQEEVTNKLPALACWDAQTLFLLIKLVLDYFSSIYVQCHLMRTIGPVIFEQSIQEELSHLLLGLLRRDIANKQWKVPIETVALAGSWTIFGAAVKWSMDEDRKRADQMAEEIFLVMSEGMMHLSTDMVSSKV